MCKGESVEIEVKFPAADGTERGARAGGIGRGFPVRMTRNVARPK